MVEGKAQLPALAIMVKQPVVGKTKTRLCPPLVPAEAAAIYQAMVQDTIDLVASLSGVQLAIAITPPEITPDLRKSSPPGTIFLPVACTDIGDCLDQVFQWLHAAGYPQLLALNSDGPSLPRGYLQRAVRLLKGVDVVLGPSEDGGYYLIGLIRPQPELFKDIEWSTNRVTAQTLHRIQQLGLSVALLPSWYDVDTAADLERLRTELVLMPAEALPHTRRFFAEYGRSSAVG